MQPHTAKYFYCFPWRFLDALQYVRTSALCHGGTFGGREPTNTAKFTFFCWRLWEALGDILRRRSLELGCFEPRSTFVDHTPATILMRRASGCQAVHTLSPNGQQICLELSVLYRCTLQRGGERVRVKLLPLW